LITYSTKYIPESTPVGCLNLVGSNGFHIPDKLEITSVQITGTGVFVGVIVCPPQYRVAEPVDAGDVDAPPAITLQLLFFFDANM
ncbi:MAG: hypothetical protein ACK55I_44500, partial [bacterium]